jgi:uncharacterized FAD-dependent dehydrogenase
MTRSVEGVMRSTPIKITGLRLRPDEPKDALFAALLARTGLSADEVKSWRILRRALDARGRGAPFVEHTVGVVPVSGAQPEGEGFIPWKDKGRTVSPITRQPASPPVVVGAGPSGLFAALRLAAYGLKPVLLERGEPIERRVRDVARYWRTGEAAPDSNVQFGEGGAGAFSDGKLTSRSKDFRREWVLEQLVEAGAPASILYDSKPHLGTDRLKKIVKNIRERLLALGARISFGERVEGLHFSGEEQLAGVCATGGVVASDVVFLGVGHSARELIRKLSTQGVEMSAKGFAIGVRAELRQAELDSCQYGRYAGEPGLGSAEFVLKASSVDEGVKRGVYSFCMCPGGVVIPAGVEAGGLVINGMSGHARSGRFANAAIVAQVHPEDFGCDPFKGYELQRSVEERAYGLSGPRAVPAQTLASFIGTADGAGGSVGGSALGDSTCPWPLVEAELSRCLPEFVTAALKRTLPGLTGKLEPLKRARLMAAETRTSSPVRIERDSELESTSVKGLYPIGEGAGYAGGIVSSAIDGVRAVDAYARRLGGDLFEREGEP